MRPPEARRREPPAPPVVRSRGALARGGTVVACELEDALRFAGRGLLEGHRANANAGVGAARCYSAPAPQRWEDHGRTALDRTQRMACPGRAAAVRAGRVDRPRARRARRGRRGSRRIRSRPLAGPGSRRRSTSTTRYPCQRRCALRPPGARLERGRRPRGRAPRGGLGGRGRSRAAPQRRTHGCRLRAGRAHRDAAPSGVPAADDLESYARRSRCASASLARRRSRLVRRRHRRRASPGPPARALDAAQSCAGPATSRATTASRRRAKGGVPWRSRRIATSRGASRSTARSSSPTGEAPRRRCRPSGSPSTRPRIARRVLGPEGGLLVWSRQEDGRQELVGAGIRGGHGGILLGAPTAVARGGLAAVMPLAWSSDARSVIFVRGNPLGTPAAFRLDPATGVETPIGDAAVGAPAGTSAMAAGSRWPPARPRGLVARLPAWLGFAIAPLATVLRARRCIARRDAAYGSESRPSQAIPSISASCPRGARPRGVALDPSGTSLVLGQRRVTPAGVEERLVEAQLDCDPRERADDRRAAASAGGAREPERGRPRGQAILTRVVDLARVRSALSSYTPRLLPEAGRQAGGRRARAARRAGRSGGAADRACTTCGGSVVGAHGLPGRARRERGRRRARRPPSARPSRRWASSSPMPSSSVVSTISRDVTRARRCRS